MKQTINDLNTLFDEAQAKSEFDFILTLINYTGIGAKEISTNLHEWFDAIEFYKTLFLKLEGKEKTRIGTLLYSTFFENSDFYNIIGSLCKNKLGFRGSSLLFWKTKKYERLLGIGEKQDYLVELLEDAGKQNIINFFNDNHYKEIRNSFFHSAYSLDGDDFILHDSEPIIIGGVGRGSFSITEFLYPKIDNVITFFNAFKQKYLESFASYHSNKEIDARFPNPTKATIMGSEKGLQGWKIKNTAQFYGKWHDSGIWYDEQHKFWAGHNVNFYFESVETIEVGESLDRYEHKADITKSDSEFHNLVDKIAERHIEKELFRATRLLLKFGDARLEKMNAEQNPFKQRSFPKIILPFYKRAVEIGSQFIDMAPVKKKIEALEAVN